MPKELPSPELLRKLLQYEPETGKLFWLERDKAAHPDDRSRKTFNSQFSHKEAFTCTDRYGYLSGRIFSKLHRAHRVIWAINYGEWPDGHIDHINGVRSDNRKCNLRCVDQGENNRNTRLGKNNKSGVIGVAWYKPRQKWRAQITINGKVTHIGYYKTLKDAAAARKACEADNGYHPNHGNPKPQSK